MITLEVINNTEIILKCIKQDNIYKTFLADIDIDNYIPDMYTKRWYLGKKNNEDLGILMIKEMSSNCLSIHGGIYEKFRHIDTAEMYKEAIQILRDKFNFKDVRFISTVHVDNKPVQKMLTKAGMIYKTTIPNAYKNGDMMIFSEV